MCGHFPLKLRKEQMILDCWHVSILRWLERWFSGLITRHRKQLSWPREGWEESKPGSPVGCWLEEPLFKYYKNILMLSKRQIRSNSPLNKRPTREHLCGLSQDGVPLWLLLAPAVRHRWRPSSWKSFCDNSSRSQPGCPAAGAEPWVGFPLRTRDDLQGGRWKEEDHRI